jgi:hypothetical protein
MAQTIAGTAVRFGILVFWIGSGLLLAVGCSQPPPAQPPLDVGRQVSDAFLALLVQGEYDKAWESTSAEFKSDEGRESFRDFVRARPALVQPLTFVSGEPIVVNGVQRTEFRYRPGTEKTTQSVKIIVSRDGTDWKVERVLVE